MDCVGYLYVHNFFLAETVRKRPDLAERSFWINLNGKVLAASSDLAALGIRTGTPARQARRTDPGAECVKYLSEDFQPMADLFCDIAYKFTPVVEPFRPSEVFLGLQDHNCKAIAQALVAEVRDLGFEGVVAVAQSRLASRLLGRRMAAGQQSILIASPGAQEGAGRSNPEQTRLPRAADGPRNDGTGRAADGPRNDGSRPSCQGGRSDSRPSHHGGLQGGHSYARLMPDNHVAFMAPHPLDALWSVQKKLRERLGRLGIIKVSDLQRFHRGELRSRFGEQGLELFEAGRGLDYFPLKAAWPPAAIAVQDACDALDNREVIYERLSQLAARLSDRLGKRHKQCRQLRIEIREEGAFAPLSDGMVMTPPAAGPNRLYLAARRMFDRLTLRRPVESIVITAEDLRVSAPRQLDLFSPLRALAGQRDELKAFLTVRFGTETLQHCSEAPVSWREQMLEFYQARE